MLEATLSAFPWPVLIEASGSGPVVCAGNRDEAMSPHGTFRCAGGPDEWVAIAVADDAAFAVLADDDRSSGSGRRRALRHARGAPGQRGRARGDRRCVDCRADARRGGRCVRRAAGARRAGADDGRGGRLRRCSSARDFLQTTAHRELGVRPLPGPAWTASRSPMRATTAAPCFGEHTREVLAEVRRAQRRGDRRVGCGRSAALTAGGVRRARAGSAGCASTIVAYCSAIAGRSSRRRVEPHVDRVDHRQHRVVRHPCVEVGTELAVALTAARSARARWTRSVAARRSPPRAARVRAPRTRCRTRGSSPG